MDIVGKCGCLTDTEVNSKVVDQMPNTFHTRGKFNQHMYTIDIYQHMKAILGRVLLDINEAKEEILIMLDELQLFLKIVD